MAGFVTFLFAGCSLFALAQSAQVMIPPGSTVQLTNAEGTSMNVTNLSDQQSAPIQATILPLQSEGSNANRAPPRDVDSSLGIVEGDLKDPARAKQKMGRRVEIKVEQFSMNTTNTLTSQHDFAIALKLYIGGKPSEDDNITQSDTFAKLDTAHIPSGFTQVFAGSYPAENNKWIPVNRIVVADVCMSLFEPTYLEVIVVPATSNAEFPVALFKCHAHLNYFPTPTETEAFWNTFHECDSQMLDSGVEYRLKLRSRQYMDKFNSALVECKN